MDSVFSSAQVYMGVIWSLLEAATLQYFHHSLMLFLVSNLQESIKDFCVAQRIISYYFLFSVASLK